MKTRALAAVPFAAILVLATRGEPHAQQLPAAPDAQTIISRVLERNPLLESFETRVHVRVRMLNFPWMSLHLDGTSYFKRPSAYDVEFDRVPNYASSVKHILADVADPLEWERDWTVTATRASANGLPLFELRMTKPSPGNVSEQDAFIDPLTYLVTRYGMALHKRRFRRDDPNVSQRRRVHAHRLPARLHPVPARAGSRRCLL